jgi:hypothetical protein
VKAGSKNGHHCAYPTTLSVSMATILSECSLEAARIGGRHLIRGDVSNTRKDIHQSLGCTRENRVAVTTNNDSWRSLSLCARSILRWEMLSGLRLPH